MPSALERALSQKAGKVDGQKGMRSLLDRFSLKKRKKKSAGGERVSSGKHVQQNEERKTGKETRTLVRLPSSNKVTYTGRRSDLDVHARSNKEKMATIRLGQEGLRERESDNAKVIECALIEN